MFINYLFLLFQLLVKGVIPGSIVIVYSESKRGKKYLLIKSRQNGAVTFPSGSMQLGESYLEVAKRELFEETGIKTKNLKSMPIVHTFFYKLLLLRLKSRQRTFKLLVVNPQNKITPKEYNILWAKWFDASEVNNKLTHPELKKTFINLLKHI